MQMKRIILTALVLAFGVATGAVIAPLLAQQPSAANNQTSCIVGQNSNAACSGKWIYFAGNTSAVDAGAWVVRVNGETGEVWYKNGKKLVLLREPDE